MRIKSEDLPTAMTCLPRPLPDAAPSIIPGRSSNWSSASLIKSLPGIQVKVVNSYAAASDSYSVTRFKSDDFPTEGKPIIAILLYPCL